MRRQAKQQEAGEGGRAGREEQEEQDQAKQRTARLSTQRDPCWHKLSLCSGGPRSHDMTGRSGISPRPRDSLLASLQICSQTPDARRTARTRVLLPCRPSQKTRPHTGARAPPASRDSRRGSVLPDWVCRLLRGGSMSDDELMAAVPSMRGRTISLLKPVPLHWPPRRSFLHSGHADSAGGKPDEQPSHGYRSATKRARTHINWTRTSETPNPRMETSCEPRGQHSATSIELAISPPRIR